MARRVFDDTGKYPALMGFDFMNTGSSAPKASGLRQVDDAIAFARRGGLVRFCWHWRDPGLLGSNRANFYVREPDPGKNTGFTIPVADGRLDAASPAYRQINAGDDDAGQAGRADQTSYIPDPDRMLADGAPWLWFTVWNHANGRPGVADESSFWTGDYYNTLEHKRKVYQHPKVITPDKLPAFLKAPQ